jgi:hypothetical protein
MQNFLLTLGYGTLALLGVAVFVAWWEHWSRTHRSAPFEELPGSPPRAIRVDVDLATLDGTPGGEQQQLQQTLNAALTHAARPSGAAPGSLAWTETRPMVGPGPAVEPKPQPVAEPGST